MNTKQETQAIEKQAQAIREIREEMVSELNELEGMNVALDHGVLSIPNRTDGINAELDRYKREQKKSRRLARSLAQIERTIQRESALELLAKHEDALVSKYGARFGVSKLKAELKNMARFETAKFMKLIEKFEKEVAAA